MTDSLEKATPSFLSGETMLVCDRQGAGLAKCVRAFAKLYYFHLNDF